MNYFHVVLDAIDGTQVLLLQSQRDGCVDICSLAPTRRQENFVLIDPMHSNLCTADAARSGRKQRDFSVIDNDQ